MAVGFTISYLLIAAIWVVLLIPWFLNAFIHRKQMPIPLHRLISIMCLLKLAHILVLIPAPAPEDLLASIICPILVTLCRIPLYSTILSLAVLVAKGWGITRLVLPFAEKKILTVIVVGVTLTEVFKLFYENFFMVVFVVLYVVVLRIVFMNMDINIRTLQEVYLFYTTVSIQDVSPLHHKLRLFYAMKLSFLIFVVTKVLLQLLTYFMTQDTRWIYGTVDEILDMAFIVALLATFRLRDFSAYNVSPPPTEESNNNPLQIPMAENLGFIVLDFPTDPKRSKKTICLAADEKTLSFF